MELNRRIEAFARIQHLSCLPQQVDIRPARTERPLHIGGLRPRCPFTPNVNKIPTTGGSQDRWGISRAQRGESRNDTITIEVIVQLTAVSAAKCATIGAATRRWGICHEAPARGGRDRCAGLPGAQTMFIAHLAAPVLSPDKAQAQDLDVICRQGRAATAARRVSDTRRNYSVHRTGWTNP
jgi:hypothetical protein